MSEALGANATLPFAAGKTYSVVEIEFPNVAKRFPNRQGGEPAVAVRNVNPADKSGDVVSVIGPPGCDKSTEVNMGAGLHLPSEGEVYVSGERVTRPVRQVAFMLQKDLLMPWRTIPYRKRFGPAVLSSSSVLPHRWMATTAKSISGVAARSRAGSATSGASSTATASKYCTGSFRTRTASCSKPCLQRYATRNSSTSTTSAWLVCGGCAKRAPGSRLLPGSACKLLEMLAGSLTALAHRRPSVGKAA